MLLELKGVSKRFGGLQALSEVNLAVPKGVIYGLIGPNGAGKTTLFNVTTGLYQAEQGQFLLAGKPYDTRAPYLLARQGIARTFQNIRLFGQMTAIENVMVGRHVRTKAGPIGAMLRTPAVRREEAEIRNSAQALLDFVGIGGLGDRVARTLSYGDQRRLEIARALATEPKLLALDEPAAGMNSSEKLSLQTLLQQIVDRGVTILLIEHDVKLVMTMCAHITVLDYGRVIAQGTPAEVQKDPAVIAAYLGGASHG